MNKPSPLKRIDSPLAQELAELILIQQDLQEAINSMTLWHRKFAEKEIGTEPWIIGKSLFRDSIVQFVACFDAKAEYHLSAVEIYGHDPNGAEGFQWFKDTRDCYAAHRFGAQRQCVVGVLEDPLTGLPRGTGHVASNYYGEPTKAGPMLAGFMQTALNHLETRLAALNSRFKNETKKLTKSDMEKLQIAKLRMKPNEAALSRSSLRKAIAAGRDPKATRR